MKQIEQDAIIMQQIYEKVLEVLYDNGVMYTRDNVARMAQILMAMAVNMIGMSSNNVAEFRTKAQKMVDDMVGMLEGMEPQKRDKMMKAIDEQIDWFEKVYEKQKKDFEEELAASQEQVEESELN